ncbi:MAG: trimethylamine methyltransferase family protein [Candidatus Eisenbacteria bacterium]
MRRQARNRARKSSSGCARWDTSSSREDSHVRPLLRLLSDDLLQRIVAEGREVLCRLGMEIHNEAAVTLLGDHGAQIDRAAGRVRFTEAMIDRALGVTPRSFELYDVRGVKTHEFSGDNVYFTPGSAAINILDYPSGTMRRPATADYVRYAKLVAGLPHLAAQSTAMIAADVPAEIQDSYRLYLSLLHCEKPVVTGAFRIPSYALMRDLQIAVRGSAEELGAKPLTIFSCCPTAPLKWSQVTSQNLLDCARDGIPVEYISMPLAGFMAPVTLVGSLVQHTAETLSGVVMSQLARPGAPALYGGSPAAFDVRYETTPMGAVETQMIDCAYSEIGHALGMPTQAYIGLSDAKLLDAQAGLETAMGATLAVLSGVNSISGPGMLDFESCQSLEKLVVDNEICGLTLRLARGIEAREDFPALPRFEELLREGHLLIAKHTRRHLREEHYIPGPAIDRANRSRWMEEGGLTLGERAHREVQRLIASCPPSRLPEETRGELTRLMSAEARRFGMGRLPAIEA